MYDELIDYCIELKLTSNQFLCLHFLITQRSVKIAQFAKTRKSKKFLSDNEKVDLINREFLIETTDGKYKVSDKFKDLYYDKFEGGNELFELYPGFIKTNNGMIPATAMDIIEFRVLYWNKINGSRREHEEVMKDVRYAIEHNLLRFGIEKFLKSEYWRKIRKLRLSDDSTLINSTNTTEHDF